MKVKVAKLWEYLKQKELSVEDFAKKLHLSTDEVEKMLRGEAVGINTARKFINGLSAELAQDLIDWEAIGVSNPLAEDENRQEEDDSLFDDFEDDDFDDFNDFEDDFEGYDSFRDEDDYGYRKDSEGDEDDEDENDYDEDDEDESDD